MPEIFQYGPYVVFFCSGGAAEPVHVHVAEGQPAEHATKIWLTRAGGCLVANNGSDVPAKDLRIVLAIVTANHALICERWHEHFGGSPTFYC